MRFHRSGHWNGSGYKAEPRGFQDHPHLNSICLPIRAPGHPNSDLSIPPTTLSLNFSNQTAGKETSRSISCKCHPDLQVGNCVPGREGRLYETCLWLFVCVNVYAFICICTYMCEYMCLSACLCVRAFTRFVYYMYQFMCSFVQVCAIMYLYVNAYS